MDSKTLKTTGLVEQHIHGAFGVDLATCTNPDDVVYLAQELSKIGVTIFFPTLVTDSIENLKKQIEIIKKAKANQPKNSALIAGIHLEGPFINPEKKGIHNKSLILEPSIKSFKELEDDIIKIVTIAPELDKNDELCKYLKAKGIKVSAGHSLTTDLSCANQVTHLFNAMGTVDHKKSSTATLALTNDDIYTEIIADSVHVNNEVLKLIFKIKPKDKVLLISDALPISHSNNKTMVFCSETIYLKDKKATDANGTLAGSAMLLPDIIKNVVNNELLSFEEAIKMASTNQLKYHNLKNNCDIFWNENLEVVDFKFN